MFLMILFFFELSGDHRDLHVLTHSFPTRRSSDLRQNRTVHAHIHRPGSSRTRCQAERCTTGLSSTRRDLHESANDAPMRSEEHTSELQSLMRISYAVFCLKKKNI